MSPAIKRIFWFINKYFMVPMMLLGFGPLFGNPVTGYIMILKTVGRKSGKIRNAPVNYAIFKGNIYCISGGRRDSDWFKNLLATPEIDVILPGGAIFGRVEEVVEKTERQKVVRQILQNAGFAGFFEGYNPFKISDVELEQKSADLPVIKIYPIGIGRGASDPGGWAWVWVWLATAAVVIYWIL